MVFIIKLGEAYNCDLDECRKEKLDEMREASRQYCNTTADARFQQLTKILLSDSSPPPTNHNNSNNGHGDLNSNTNISYHSHSVHHTIPISPSLVPDPIGGVEELGQSNPS